MKYLSLLLLFLATAAHPQTLPASTSYYVGLSWSESDPSVTGYYVYREQGSGSYLQLNENAIASLSYDDTELLYGVSYSYYIESVNSYGRSTPSNTQTVRTPFVPYAPVVGTIQGL